MNYNQNHKLSQITPETLIVGIDIAKNKHVARAQDDRGFEFGKRLIFDNRVHGFEQLLNWVSRLQKEHRKSELIIGAEPTGHFWLSLAYYLKAKDINFVLVNPMHVKKSKELDDNSPTKNDTKDARVIAQLIKDGRYSVPNLLDGIYAELREGIKLRDQLVKQLIIIEGRIQNHIQRYFPEFNDVFKDWEGKTALFSLRNFPFPSDLRGVTPEEVLAQWKTTIKRGVGIKRATQFIEKARKSVGIEVGLRFARKEIHSLLDQYELYQSQLTELDMEITDLMKDIPGAQEMMNIKGLGSITIATFLSEVGDLKKYDHPQQLVNMAGLSLREHSSGKFKGQTRITKRGRKKLRKALYLAVRPLVASNSTFKTLHRYYTTRSVNPLKKQQSLIAMCGKLLRVLFVIGRKQCEFEGSKLLQGLTQMKELQAV
ncbi:IS110 family transposase [Virgibacillus sp. AGTR]|nr:MULTISPECIES: IS110 family transposase [unclassified Virgibacillus]MCC2252790.1 IS110 family transposase [Virgibacillus sp. AGTR]QRZ16618.1 IS110 family transposase [Virgibacillus sp. AGTR]QRZ16953.1 IS110 family transposase [Virgibacillus sp. AGTR]